MATKYCGCGQRFFVDFRWNGQANIPKVQIEEGIKTVEVTHCPGCGEWLQGHKLLSEVTMPNDGD
jgi:sarcosine oxidase delta subunit